ncbi:MAG TPA: NUDIX domain-containing protein [bacterium]|nr:NUDIX domain-containing protein [bacterium]
MGAPAAANAHCGWCGAAFAANAPWPRTCAACGKTSYRNPIPVAVVLLPVDRGLLMIRRAIPPQVGKLALPGGYVNDGEDWRVAGARELFEETGIRIASDSLREFRVKSAPDGTLLVFGAAAPLARAALPPFVPTDETSECVVVEGALETAFPLHTEAVREWFASR